MYQTTVGFVVCETTPVCPAFQFFLFLFVTLIQDFRNSHRISWESLETCFLPPGCHKHDRRIILWEYKFSLPLMTSYGLMLTFVYYCHLLGKRNCCDLAVVKYKINLEN